MILACAGVAALLLLMFVAGTGVVGLVAYRYLAASPKGPKVELALAGGDLKAPAGEPRGGEEAAPGKGVQAPAVEQPPPPRPADPVPPLAPPPPDNAPPPLVADPPAAGPEGAASAQPPPGWREYIPPSKAFSVWLPNAGRRTERTRDFLVRGARLRLSLVEVETRDRSLLWASQVGLPLRPGERIHPMEAIEVFRDIFLKEFGGTIADQSDVQLGRMTGKEYLIEMANGRRTKLRLYATGPNGVRVYQVSVTGTPDQIDDDTARLFFSSYKHQGMVRDDLKKKAQDPAAK
jgi:hypothetical protein